MSKKSRTFEEASRMIQKSLEAHLDKKLVSEETSDSEESDDFQPSSLLDSVFSSYEPTENRKEWIESLSHSCLICLSSNRREDKLWNCSTCSTSFHLHCIQKWAKDSVFLMKSENEQNHEKTKIPYWACPKCRTEYSSHKIPQHYYCYCGKVEDPKVDPWIVAHSCGEPCQKSLKPNCGHHCTLLCHPGLCPPCPKTLSQSCHCGYSAPALRRCDRRHWSCNKECSQELLCTKHKCSLPCHSGPCPPCSKKSVQLCRCHRQQRKTPCSEADWSCGEKCLRDLDCKHHKCDEICHTGKCPPCKLSLLRTCPCGKTTHQLDCTIATPTCGDTCGKKLSCGSHICSNRCHRGDCGPCFEILRKSCRCGSQVKELPCNKDFFCETKCKVPRDCLKHLCGRKCCEGLHVSFCETPCLKVLPCKNHKCASRCHSGNCFPCSEIKEVSCQCGAKKILVPCGMEKTVKAPHCKGPCTKGSICHHEVIQSHFCHFGNCPPCTKPCNLTLKCGHKCRQICHDAVSIKKTVKVKGPWEPSYLHQTSKLDCGPCQESIFKNCLGDHETLTFLCSEARESSCGRPCGRLLPCGNHSCVFTCHRTSQPCEPCQLLCEKSLGSCGHLCPLSCHSGPCPPCSQNLAMPCHCKSHKLKVQCSQKAFVSGSCDEMCSKTLDCGHRCFLNCHSGLCPPRTECRKKIKVSCPCKKRKEERICSTVLPSLKRIALACNAECPSCLESKMKETPTLTNINPTFETDKRSKAKKNKHFIKNFWTQEKIVIIFIVLFAFGVYLLSQF